MDRHVLTSVEGHTTYIDDDSLMKPQSEIVKFCFTQMYKQDYVIYGNSKAYAILFKDGVGIFKYKYGPYLDSISPFAMITLTEDQKGIVFTKKDGSEVILTFFLEKDAQDWLECIKGFGIVKGTDSFSSSTVNNKE